MPACVFWFVLFLFPPGGDDPTTGSDSMYSGIALTAIFAVLGVVFGVLVGLRVIIPAGGNVLFISNHVTMHRIMHVD